MFVGKDEVKFLRNLFLFRIGVTVPIEIIIEFSGERLAEVRLRFAARTTPEAEDTYSFLREQVFRTYAIGPSGPVFADEQRLTGRRNVLLFEKQANALFPLPWTVGATE